MKATKHNLFLRFQYEPDGKIDSYHILKSEGKVKGDCDDFAITILYEEADYSFFRLMKNLITRRSNILLVRDPNLAPHVVAQHDGLYVDTWYPNYWSRKLRSHKLIRRVKTYTILIKLLIGKFVKN